MASSLKLLPLLRQFSSKQDPARYLETEMRQNFKSIEDAFRKIANSTRSSSNMVVGTSVDFSTTSTSSVSTGLIASMNPENSFINILVGCDPETGSGAFAFRRSGGTGLLLQIVRRNDEKIIFKVNTANERNVSPIYAIDHSPIEGVENTYEVFMWANGAATVYLESAQIILTRG